MVDYTPTTEEVRGRASWDALGDEYDPGAAAEFDCWLDEHDRQVLASRPAATAESARLLAGIAKIRQSIRAGEAQADVLSATDSPVSLMRTWLDEYSVWFLVGACWVGTLVLLSWAFPSLNMPPLFP